MNEKRENAEKRMLEMEKLGKTLTDEAKLNDEARRDVEGEIEKGAKQQAELEKQYYEKIEKTKGDFWEYFSKQQTPLREMFGKPDSDSICKEAFTLFVSILVKRQTISDDDSKDALTDEASFKKLIEDKKVEDMTKANEAFYTKKHEELTQKIEKNPASQDIKKKAARLLEIAKNILDTVPIFRSLERVIARKEKKEKDLMGRMAEKARLEITKINPIQIERQKETIASIDNVILIVNSLLIIFISLKGSNRGLLLNLINCMRI